MKLLTAAQLPQLYTQEHSKDPTVYLKFFTPDSNWDVVYHRGFTRRGQRT